MCTVAGMCTSNIFNKNSVAYSFLVLHRRLIVCAHQICYKEFLTHIVVLYFLFVCFPAGVHKKGVHKKGIGPASQVDCCLKNLFSLP